MIKRCPLAAVWVLLLAACAPFGAAPSASPTRAPVSVAEPATATAPAVRSPVASSDPSPIPIGGVPAQTPVPGASAEPGTASAPAADEIAALDASGRPDRNAVDLARALGSCRSAPSACPAVARTSPLDASVGEVRAFYITDMASRVQSEIQAELRYIGPVALMYVEQGLPYNQADLEHAARAFEQEIYPRTREIFGSEAQPGVDGDLRITILNARDPSGGILGYYSSQDSVPRQVNRYSNERDMFFMNIAQLDFNNPAYLDVLAHEFQHMIHQHEQPSSAIWFNEGASQLSDDFNGFSSSAFASLYLSAPDVQLTGWSAAPGTTGAHYGAAHMFLRYIYAQYAGEDQILPLIRADAGDNLQTFVDLAARTRPDLTSFGQIVADWAVANLIDSPIGDGRYTYATGHSLPSLLPARVEPADLAPSSALRDTVAQYGADYFALPAGPRTLTFKGATTVGLASEMPRGRLAWWSDRSDNSIATLTRPFDLRGLSTATLRFATWYELENDYDYAFVTVSADGGATWETLPGTSTTTYDPQGVNYGQGITGVSGRPGLSVNDRERGVWVDEAVDLSPYVGKEILVRFWQINDQAFNAPGMLIDDLSVPELGYSDDVESGDGGWQPEGFVRVDGDLPQRWELRLVRIAADGATAVEPLAVDATGAASASLAPGERGVLVVIGATPHTSERASYEVNVE
ncbi:MAG: hypothetical protein HGA45_17220 [Chloroflexales bacterium]|nr:hypothetical protein [Chloroflexales bacterium]